MPGRDKPGGVFLRSADQIPEADLTLLHVAASIVLVGARGALPQQVGIPGEALEPPQRPAWKRASEDPSPPLPFLELPYFNGMGGFTPDGREYAIYLDAGKNTPDPWVNVMANPTFGTLVSESGAGFTWSGNSQRNRLSTWSNDPVTDPASEALFVRDEETGLCWTPTASPIREEAAYRTRHGAGYTVFEHNSNGISQELTVFVPMDHQGGQPVKLQRLRLKNDSSRSRTLSVTWYVELVLGEHRETSQMHVVTDWDDESQTLMARNRFHPEYGDRIAFAALSVAAESWCGDRTAFLGRNGSLRSAAAMERTSLSGLAGAGLDPCAALRTMLELAPGEQTEVACVLGEVESREAARTHVFSFRKTGVDAALEETKAWWNELLGTVEAHTPELSVDFLHQPMVGVSVPELSDLGTVGVLPVRRRVRLPRPASGRHGSPVRRAIPRARPHNPCGEQAVQGGRRPALVACAERSRDPITHLRRPSLAAIRRCALPASYGRLGDPGRAGSLPRRSNPERRSA